MPLGRARLWLQTTALRLEIQRVKMRSAAQELSFMLAVMRHSD
jgi:predicted secreted protein